MYHCLKCRRDWKFADVHESPKSGNVNLRLLPCPRCRRNLVLRDFTKREVSP